MPSLHLRDVSYAHLAATPILAGVDLDLSSGGMPARRAVWVGVVGANGAGKTTLLRVLAGELHPTGGTVERQGVALLVPQTVDELTPEVRGFARSWDGTALRLRSRLALDGAGGDGGPEELASAWPGLSPGQRTRWQVAAALAAAPDILLLDEPTNHLDAAARDLLVEALAGWRGLGVIVSHDRTVLDRLTTRTLRLERGRVQLAAGSSSEAAARWREAEAAERAAHDRARRELRRQQRVLGDLRRDRHGADAGPRRQRRLAGAADPDAREAGRRLAQQKAEAALARRVGQLRSRVERTAAEVASHELHREHGGAVGFAHAPSGRRVLVHLEGDVRHAGGAVVLRGVDVTLRRGERIHVVGVNGAGKTSLLRAVLAVLERTSETVAWLPQELDDPADEVARVRALDPTSRGRVLGTVALLGIDPDRVLVTGEPSPGEARKLALARLLAGEASLLVLDEPTNHLDLPSIERLQDALTGWPGALLLVTHDDALAGAATSTRWLVADGRVRVGQEGR